MGAQKKLPHSRFVVFIKVARNEIESLHLYNEAFLNPRDQPFRPEPQRSAYVQTPSSLISLELLPKSSTSMSCLCNSSR